MTKNKHPVAGNALFMILIAIFLLGAITAMIVRTSGTTEETGSTERASIAASEILRQAGAMKQAINTLKLRGCSEDEINFHSDNLVDDMWTSYDNPNAPADQSCDVFSQKGAGLTYYILPEDYYFSSGGDPYRWFVSTNAHASYNVGGTPTTMSDLVWYVPAIRKDICLAINRTLGIPPENTGEPSQDFWGPFWEYYHGEFHTPGGNGIADESGDKHFEKPSACFLDADNNYTFYMLLIAK